MSERMTTEEWKALLLRARQNPGQCLAMVAMEGNRARAGEDEKDAEVTRLRRLMARAAYHMGDLQPDTLAGVVVSLLTAGGPEAQEEVDVIGALADALITVRERHRSLPAGRSPMEPSDLRSIDAALRLAGRLP